MKNQKRISTPVGILIIIIVFTTVVVGGFFVYRHYTKDLDKSLDKKEVPGYKEKKLKPTIPIEEEDKQVIGYAANINGNSQSEINLVAKELVPVVIVSIREESREKRRIAYLKKDRFDYIYIDFYDLDDDPVGLESLWSSSFSSMDESCLNAKSIEGCINEDVIVELYSPLMGAVKDCTFEYSEVYLYKIKITNPRPYKNLPNPLEGFTVYVSKDGQILGCGEAIYEDIPVGG